VNSESEKVLKRNLIGIFTSLRTAAGIDRDQIKELALDVRRFKKLIQGGREVFYCWRLIVFESSINELQVDSIRDNISTYKS
jgi:hypothetical protein